MDNWTNPLFLSIYDYMAENMLFLCNNEDKTLFYFSENHRRTRLMIVVSLNDPKNAMRIEVRYPIQLSRKHHKAILEKVSQYNCHHYLGFLTFDTSVGELASTWASPLEDAFPMEEEAITHLFSVLLRGLCNMGRTAMELEFGLSAEIRNEIQTLTDVPKEVSGE
jgi:hypothetical protein